MYNTLFKVLHISQCFIVATITELQVRDTSVYRGMYDSPAHQLTRFLFNCEIFLAFQNAQQQQQLQLFLGIKCLTE